MTDEVVVIGASGFGRETLDTLEAMQSAGTALTIVGVVDDAPSAANLARLGDRGTKYLGTLDQWLATEPTARFLLAIGAPKVRQRLAERLEGAGLSAYNAVHPRAIIGSLFDHAQGVVVCAGAIISTNVRLEKHVHVNPGAVIGHDSVLHEFVSVNPQATISGEVEIDSETLVGAAATVLQQLRVGRGCVIGAGSVVTKDVPDSATVVGVPGRW